MRKALSILSILCLILIGCEEELPTKPYPEINTLEVTNISENGAQFNAEVRNPQGYTIKKHGFVWSPEENPTLEHNDQVVNLDQFHSGNFTATITSDLTVGELYYVRAFLETDDFLVYGKAVRFKSQGSNHPVISSVSPLSVNYCDTLYIRGASFSSIKSNNKITIGQVSAEPLFTSDTLLKVMVPGRLKVPKFNVSVLVAGNGTRSKDSVSLKKPVFLNYDPPEVTLGDEFVMYGNNFPKEKEALRVQVNGVNVNILEISCEHIKASIPDDATAPLVVSIKTVTGFEVIDDQLTLLRPTITALLPDQGFIGDQVEIQGSHFNALPEALSIKVGNSDVAFQILSDNAIIVNIPAGAYPNQETLITIFFNDQPVSSKSFKILD